MSHLARRLRNKRARKSSARHNPPLFMDMVEQALPAGAGFIATRGMAKIGMAAVEKRWPSKSKHVGAAISVASFVAAWFLGHKVKFLQKYHVPITAGSFIAAGLNLLQIYVPKIGWLFGDPTKATAGGIAAPMQQSALPSNLEPIDDDPTLYTWNDSYDAGRRAQGQNLAPGQPAATSSDPIADLMNEDDDMGVFSGGMAGN